MRKLNFDAQYDLCKKIQKLMLFVDNKTFVRTRKMGNYSSYLRIYELIYNDLSKNSLKIIC